MDSKFKNWKAMVFAGLTAAVALPLAVGANAALDSGSFTVKSVNSKDSSIVAYAGMRTNISSGETPGSGEEGENPGQTPEGPEDGEETFPEAPNADGTYAFTINMDAEDCVSPAIYVGGVAKGSVITSPKGVEKELANGWNPIAETGSWTVNGGFTKLGEPEREDGWVSDYGANKCLTSVDKWDDTNLVDATNAFAFAQNLESVPSELPSTVTSLSGMFKNNDKFNGDISGWDTSNVTKMDRMFNHAFAFNQPIGGWNISKVDSLYATFAGAKSFDQDLSNWDVSNITTMRSLFEGAEAFNQDLNGWKLNSLENMASMFKYADSFDQDLTGWNTSTVTNMSNVFQGNKTYNRDITNWNTSKVTNMSGMFYGAEAFDQDISNWETNQVTDMSSMFYNAYSFKQDISGWDTSNVTNMSNMFRMAWLLNVDLSGWDVSKVVQKDFWNYGAEKIVAPIWK